MKKFLALLLVLILSVSLVACDSSDVPVGEEKNEIGAEENNNEEQKENVKKEPEVVKYKASTYKVGTDIPAGEYVLFSDNSFGAYFEITKDSSGSLDSIIANNNFFTNSIVTISEGQYFTMTGCYAVKSGDALIVDTTGDGMFKVGIHIPAGEYKLEVSEDAFGFGYYEVSSTSEHNLNSIVANDNFEGATYITVSAGQYLTLSGCKIVSQPDVSYVVNENIDFRTFVMYNLHDEIPVYISGGSTIGAHYGVFDNISANVGNDAKAIFDTALQDLDLYINGETCEYESYWNFLDNVYWFYSEGRLGIMDPNMPAIYNEMFNKTDVNSLGQF